MPKITCIVYGNHENQTVELNSAGTVIGRGERCDLVIHSRDVSRRHARIYQDPAGNWTIEDLNSSNGTFVNGKSIQACSISPDDVIEIGPASISLDHAAQLRSSLAPPDEIPKIRVEDFGTEVFYDQPQWDQCPVRPCPKCLDQVQSCLSKLDNLTRIYREVCPLLAQQPKTAAAVIRVHEPPPSLTRTPAILGYHFGGNLAHMGHGASEKVTPLHRGFRVSHRLLEAVCVREKPLMSKTIFTCDTEVTLSLIDEHSPRALMCSPINTPGQSMDLLYVDVPIDGHFQPGPEEMFVLVQAVAEQIQNAACISSETEGRES